MSTRITPTTQYIEVSGTPRERNPLYAFDRMNSLGADDDFQFGWSLQSECPGGGMWCCGDGLRGATNAVGITVGAADPLAGATAIADPTGPTNYNFSAFSAYQVMGCTGGTARMPDEIAGTQSAAQAWLDANSAGWLTQGLEIGICGNRGLIDSADVTGAGGATDFEAVAATLIRNRRNIGIFDRPIIHVPDWYAPIIDDDVWVNRVADIVLGPGYGVNSLVVPSATEAWVYITGKVEYAMTDVVPGGSVSGSDLNTDDASIRRKNRSWELAERYMIYRFDPCGSYKAKALVA